MIKKILTAETATKVLFAGANGFQRVSLMILGIAIFRKFGVQGFSLFSIFQFALGFFVLFAGMGANITALKFISEFRAKDFSAIFKTTNKIINYYLFGVGLLIVLYFIFYDFFTNLIFKKTNILFEGLLLICQVLFMSGILIAGSILQGLGRHNDVAKAALFNALMILLLAIYAHYFSENIKEIFAVWLFTSICQLIWLGYFIKREFNQRRINCESRSHSNFLFDGGDLSYKSIAIFSIKSLSFSCIWMGAVFMSSLVLTHTGDQQEMSIFAISYQWFALLIYVPGLLGSVSISTNAASLALLGEKDFKKKIKNSLFFNFTVAFIVCLSGIFLSPLLIQFYGGNGQSNVQFELPVMTMAAFFCIIANPLLNALISTGYLGKTILMAVVWATSVFIFLEFFEQKSAIVVASSYLAAYCFYFLLAMYFAFKLNWFSEIHLKNENIGQR